MNLGILFKGIVIGFSIAMPVGPIGVLCIQRTLNYGKNVGFLSGLGAATADAIYGCIAGFGITLISDFLVKHQPSIKLIGSIFLIYLAYRTYISKPSSEAAKTKEDGKNMLTYYLSTLFLTLTNPMTIIFFAGIIAGLGIINERFNYIYSIIFVSGVFTGSALWWLILSNIANLFHKKMKYRFLVILNGISALVIFGFGIYTLKSLF